MHVKLVLVGFTGESNDAKANDHKSRNMPYDRRFQK
jgi:hypothetical protein